MLKIVFADKSEQEVLQRTTIYPSGSSAVRSRMELHLAGDAMGLEAFAALVGDEGKTRAMRLVETRPAAQDGEEGAAAEETVVRENLYTGYTLPVQVGRQRVETVDHETGAVQQETHLVAVLEQLTYIEQQLAALGVKV